MLGILKEIKSSINGYECDLRISFEEPICSIWCYGFSLKEVPIRQSINSIEILSEKDSISKKVSVGERYDFILSVVFVNEVTVLSNYKSPTFMQFNDQRTHTLFTAKVKGIVEDKLICDIGILGSNISVILENSAKGINIGDTIEFSGEIKVDLA